MKDQARSKPSARRGRVGRRTARAVAAMVVCAAVTLALGQASAPATTPPASAQAAPREPIAPLPLEQRLDPRRVALGERLFADVRLSADRQRACSTCHPVERGGMDGQPRATAVDGQPRLRNTPTIFNAGFSFALNWDGAATSLEDHAQKLLTSPNVMNASWPELLSRLRADADYPKLFSAAYGSGPTQANVLDALASYERSLVTPNARFDRYLRGEASLSAQERRGYELFKSYGCVACHQGLNVGGNLFQKFGVFAEPGNPTPGDEADLGRFRVTRAERDRGVFRVPSLRNVALTAPYFHDGRAPTLDVAVDTMARVQLGQALAADDRQAIVAFLHSLTGEFRGRPLTTASAPAAPSNGAR